MMEEEALNLPCKKKISLIVSINVHEKYDFLLKQIENIKTHIKDDFVIVLNCNQYMLGEAKKYGLPSYVYLNPNIIEKRRYHGSICKGIYSNMVWSLDNYDFTYFIILSSRTFFYRDITVADLNKFPKNEVQYMAKNTVGWWWPRFRTTKLFKEFRMGGFAKCAHEGLVFHSLACKDMVDYLTMHPKIRGDLFEHRSCVEEFALQTLSLKAGKMDGFRYIGRGMITETENKPPNDSDHFTYKIWRV